MPIAVDINDDGKDQIEPIPDWHLPILKARLENIDDTLFVDAIEFIQSLKKMGPL